MEHTRHKEFEERGARIMARRAEERSCQEIAGNSLETGNASPDPYLPAWMALRTGPVNPQHQTDVYTTDPTPGLARLPGAHPLQCWSAAAGGAQRVPGGWPADDGLSLPQPSSAERAAKLRYLMSAANSRVPPPATVAGGQRQMSVPPAPIACEQLQANVAGTVSSRQVVGYFDLCPQEKNRTLPPKANSALPFGAPTIIGSERVSVSTRPSSYTQLRGYKRTKNEPNNFKTEKTRTETEERARIEAYHRYVATKHTHRRQDELEVRTRPRRTNEFSSKNRSAVQSSNVLVREQGDVTDDVAPGTAVALPPSSLIPSSGLPAHNTMNAPAAKHLENLATSSQRSSVFEKYPSPTSSCASTCGSVSPVKLVSVSATHGNFKSIGGPKVPPERTSVSTVIPTEYSPETPQENGRATILPVLPACYTLDARQKEAPNNSKPNLPTSTLAGPERASGIGEVQKLQELRRQWHIKQEELRLQQKALLKSQHSSHAISDTTWFSMYPRYTLPLQKSPLDVPGAKEVVSKPEPTSTPQQRGIMASNAVFPLTNPTTSNKANYVGNTLLGELPRSAQHEPSTQQTTITAPLQPTLPPGLIAPPETIIRDWQESDASTDVDPCTYPTPFLLSSPLTAEECKTVDDAFWSMENEKEPSPVAAPLKAEALPEQVGNSPSLVAATKDKDRPEGSTAPCNKITESVLEQDLQSECSDFANYLLSPTPAQAIEVEVAVKDDEWCEVDGSLDPSEEWEVVDEKECI